MRRGGNANFVHDLGGQLAQTIGHTHAGFGDEVHRTQLQRAHGDFCAALGQRGNHQHWHGAQTHDAAQEIDAVHLGHFDVQSDHVWVELTNHFTRNQGVVCGADAFHVRLAIDDFCEQAAHQRRVVHHNYPGLSVHFLSNLSQNRSTLPPALVLANCAALPRERSCSTKVSGCAWAKRLTMALPVAGKYTTLRG